VIKRRRYFSKREGRPRMRWLDEVESDLKNMKMKGWKDRDREQWRMVAEVAKFHPGLQCRVEELKLLSYPQEAV
jgi:hypothetical protein